MILKFLMTLFTAILAFFGLSTPTTPLTTTTTGHTRPTVGPLTRSEVAEPADLPTSVTVAPKPGDATIPEDPNFKTISAELPQFPKGHTRPTVGPEAAEPTESAAKLVHTAKKDGQDLLNGREPGDGKGPIPGSALDTTLPATAHVATPAEIAQIRTKNWQSTVRANTVLKFQGTPTNSDWEWLHQYYAAKPPKEKIPEADAINAFAGSSCNGRGAGIAWFKGAELHYYLTDRGAQWHRECDNASDVQHAEALNYIVGRPTVYLDGNGTMYLKRLADGKVSQWREVRG